MGGAGAGNPPAPSAEIGYPTYYLWHLVWARDVWLDILGNFLHLESKEVEGKDGKKIAELRPTDSELQALRQMMWRRNREVLRIAHERSVFASLATHVHVAQGHRFASHVSHSPPQVSQMVETQACFNRSPVALKSSATLS